MQKLLPLLFSWSSILYGSVLLSACSGDESPNPVPGGEGSLTSETNVTDREGNTYLVGTFQATANNQNPIVEKRNAEGRLLWSRYHETTGVDGRATLIALDANEQPWVVFTVDGGSNDANYITSLSTTAGAFEGVYEASYGRGGGPVVSVVARLDPGSGELVKGSFISARLSSGNTNTLRITAIGFREDQVIMEASSAAWPPGEGSSYERFPDITDADRVDGAFLLYYEMSNDLSAITTARLRD